MSFSTIQREGKVFAVWRKTKGSGLGQRDVEDYKLSWIKERQRKGREMKRKDRKATSDQVPSTLLPSNEQLLKKRSSP
jgi:hypothetical protein